MANQNESYSVFISTEPYVSSSGNLGLVYLCSDPSFDYSLNYSGTTTGILGQGSEQAIFVDGSAGAVGNISISGVRCNPTTSTTSAGGTGGSFVTKTNGEIYWTMRNMLKKNQMFQGAYVLRIYNVDWSKIDTSNPTEVQRFKNAYRDLYVHISKFDMTFDWKTPNEAQISMTCIRRNKTKGFGDA